MVFAYIQFKIKWEKAEIKATVEQPLVLNNIPAEGNMVKQEGGFTYTCCSKYTEADGRFNDE